MKNFRKLKYFFEFIKKVIKGIKEYSWLIELIIAWTWLYLSYYAINIALPEYREYINKSNIPSINWQWEVEFETLESSFKEYIWDKNTYNMFFIWDKNEYISKWERVKTNGKYIENFNNRDRIEFKAFINNNKIYSLFDLYWQRKTDWSLEVILSEDANSFEWKFTWNAAESKGIVKWLKIN